MGGTVSVPPVFFRPNEINFFTTRPPFVIIRANWQQALISIVEGGNAMKQFTRGAFLLVAGLLFSAPAFPVRAGAAMPAPAAATRVRKNKVEKPAKRYRSRKVKGNKSRRKHS
jgi:hypothetical protein